MKNSTTTPTRQCTTVAIYADDDGHTVDVPVPLDVVPRPIIRHRRRLWTLQSTVTVRPGESVDDAVLRQIGEEQSAIRAMVSELVAEHTPRAGAA